MRPAWATIRESCRHNRTQPRHGNRREPIRLCAISNLRRSQGVTTTSQTPTPNIAPPPSATPRNALAPARSRSNPSMTRFQVIPQSHTCGPANARVSSKHQHSPAGTSHHLSRAPKMPQTLHTTLTPQHRSTPSHTTRTPYALLNIKSHPSTPHCMQTLAKTQHNHTRPKSSQARTNVNTQRALVQIQLPP